MKLFHFQVVSECRSGNECKFGPKKCWFIHQENVEMEYYKAKKGIQINHNDKNSDMEWKKSKNWQNSNIRKISLETNV